MEVRLAYHVHALKALKTGFIVVKEAVDGLVVKP